MRLRLFLCVTALSLVSVAASANHARADFSISINEGNTGSGGVGQFTGPYANVQFTQTNANTLHVVITALNNGSQFFLFRTVGINLNAGVSFVAGSLSAATGIGSITPVFAGDSGNLNGFDSFNHSIDAGNGGDAGLTSLSFDLTGIAVVGNGLNFLALNDDNRYIAMHINAYGNSSYTGGALKTGFAADTGAGPGPGPNVPAPPTAILAAAGGLSFGLSGLVGWKRRRTLATA